MAKNLVIEILQHFSVDGACAYCQRATRFGFPPTGKKANDPAIGVGCVSPAALPGFSTFAVKLLTACSHCTGAHVFEVHFVASGSDGPTAGIVQTAQVRPDVHPITLEAVFPPPRRELSQVRSTAGLRIAGAKPKPRVLLLGKFKNGFAESLGEFCPTVRVAGDVRDIGREVPVIDEFDLLVVSDGIGVTRELSGHVHVISFGREDVWTSVGGEVLPLAALGLSGEEYTVPAIGEYLREIQAELGELLQRREMKTTICAGSHSEVTFGFSVNQASTEQLCEEGALLVSQRPKGALGMVRTAPASEKCVAWFPNVTPRVHWIRACLKEWGLVHGASFPGVTDWDSNPPWQTVAELDLMHAIQRELRERAEHSERSCAAERDFRCRLDAARATARAGEKRLLTAQGDELVDAVVAAFVKLGFAVEKADATLGANEPKREDLRVTHPSRPGWIALGEVKGYGGSGGKSADLIKLCQHKERHAKKCGRTPDRLFYIVNQTFTRSPSDRKRPLDGSVEDVAEFAEAGGLVLSTCDLFRLQRDDAPPEVLERLLCSTGFFQLD